MNRQSLRKYFGKNKVSLPQEPRDLEVIAKDLSREYWEVGKLELQIHQLRESVKQRLLTLQKLNDEGYARKEINDKQENAGKEEAVK
jgi:hypothetical protein